MTVAGRVGTCARRLSRLVPLAEAVGHLAVARVRLRRDDFSRLSAELGQHMAETPSAPWRQADRVAALDVARAIQRAATVTPWRTACFEQALAGQRMLRRRAVPCTLYLGVGRADAGVIAHAWLRAGDIAVTGGIPEGYAVVATYADGAPAG